MENNLRIYKDIDDGNFRMFQCRDLIADDSLQENEYNMGHR